MSRFGWVIPAVASIGLVGLLGASARAALVVDQQNSDSKVIYQYLAVNPGVGQSFTPTLSTLDFASFPLYTAPSPASTYRVDVYSGDGFGGSVIGSSMSQVLPLGTFQNVEFDFASSVNLTPGNRYTLRLVRVSGSNTSLFLSSDSTNPYAGGTQYSYSGALETGYDTVFSEGVGSLPEPSSIAAIGLLALAGHRRRIQIREATITFEERDAMKAAQSQDVESGMSV